MNNMIKYILFFAFVFLVACNPEEERFGMGKSLTIDQLDISAQPLVIDGKRSNKVVLENRSPILQSWDYGLSSTQKVRDTVLLVITGNTDITFTGLNPDGTTISKVLTVNVEKLTFPVPPEYGLLCGTGTKEWVYDDTAPAVYGNGGYRNDVAPAWWINSINAMKEIDPIFGAGIMKFSIQGGAFEKISGINPSVKSVGRFSFDMSKVTYKEWEPEVVWAKGKLYTNGTNILYGVDRNKGETPVYEYDIIELTENKMILAFRVENNGCWFWCFKAK